MLLRHDDQGTLAIGQASHAWISGQLACSWGNAQFPAPEPRREVCLAAAQHDVGMGAWDLEPARNPATGLPYSFTEMPLETHLELWSAGPRRLISQSRYAALLVSMHGTRLYRRRDLESLRDDERAAINGYLGAQQRLQDQLKASLRAAEDTAQAVHDPGLQQNGQLIWTWDFLSLALCLDWAPCKAREVPTAEGSVDMELKLANERGAVRLAPWPFDTDALVVRCEGRRLNRRSADDADLNAALAQASWEMVEFELRPG